jgi:hypothetical protein
VLLGADIPRAVIAVKAATREASVKATRAGSATSSLAANLGFIVLHILQTLVGLARRVVTQPSGDRS